LVASFAQEGTQQHSFAWLEDSVPEGAAVSGSWAWEKEQVYSGEAAHTDGVKKGIHEHSFRVKTPINLQPDSVIEQYVYLDLANPPKGIMIKIIPNEGKEITLYWEGEEEVFADTAEYMEAWYMGVISEAGKWEKLTIRLSELEIAPLSINGISFITYDGKSYWDATIVTNPGKE
ncbi:MAG: hypothetical protein JW946_04970, partial [Candidatus Omnitrophica bacterium]|nr:hypothetical protein [Candidatus Omnitrophota bacterium]